MKEKEPSKVQKKLIQKLLDAANYISKHGVASANYLPLDRELINRIGKNEPLKIYKEVND